MICYLYVPFNVQTPTLDTAGHYMNIISTGAVQEHAWRLLAVSWSPSLSQSTQGVYKLLVVVCSMVS